MIREMICIVRGVYHTFYQSAHPASVTNNEIEHIPLKVTVYFIVLPSDCMSNYSCVYAHSSL